MSAPIDRRRLLAMAATAGAASALAGVATAAPAAAGPSGDVDVFDVRAFGALGTYDPATRTGPDDRAAIRAAMAAVAAAGGGTLHFPAGRYKASLGGTAEGNLIQLVSNSCVLFDPGATIYVAPDDRTVRYRVIDAVGVSRVQVLGARIVGNLDTKSPATIEGVGIRVLSSTDALVDNCSISKVPGIGVHVGASTTPSVDVTVQSCHLTTNAGRGIQVTGATGMAIVGNLVEVHFLGVDVSPSTGQTNSLVRVEGNQLVRNGIGIQLSETTGINDAIQVHANHIDQNASHGVVGRARHLNVVGNAVRRNRGDGIQLTAGGATVTANSCTDNTGAGVRLAASDSVATGNRVRTNAGGAIVNTGLRNVVGQNVVV
jgi:hypothetical protein